MSLDYSNMSKPFTKITPDLVAKLSTEDIDIIGFSDRKKIMELRLKCSTFGCKQPERDLKSDGKVAPKFKIP